MSIDEIRANFELLDDWEDRYRYVIELGRALPAMPDALKTDATKVRGCASQVWLVSRAMPQSVGSAPVLVFQGESDALIVRGLIAILLEAVDGKTAAELSEMEINGVFRELGLAENLTPQRSNGLKSMIERIKADARSALPAGAA